MPDNPKNDEEEPRLDRFVGGPEEGDALLRSLQSAGTVSEADAKREVLAHLREFLAGRPEADLNDEEREYVQKVRESMNDPQVMQQLIEHLSEK